MTNFNLRKGYHYFNPLHAFNFQLNRWYSGGWGQLSDFMDVGARLKGFADWKPEMVKIAEKALSEGRLQDAAIYYRGAEFYTTPGDPDKERLYNQFITLFDKIFNDGSFERVDIPYEQGYLSAMHLKAAPNNKGTIVIHGGFDSFIEEFYPIALYVHKMGYNIILFEGPGQGRVLHKQHIPMTPAWEKPTGAVLDFFNLDDVTLIGVSLGGYLAARAAAFDTRITKVVLYNVIYDLLELWLALMSPARGLILKTLLNLKASSLVNALARKIQTNNMWMNWSFSHGMYVQGVDNAYDYLKNTQRYTCSDISQRITQKVLVMAAEDEMNGHAPHLLKKQVQALTNAKKVSSHVFTRQELQCYQAEHCQVGNLPYALKYITNWIDNG